MAGSKRWFGYVSDGAANFALENDESKGEAVATPGGICLPALVAGALPISRGIRPRYVNAFDTALPARRTQFKIGTLAVFNTITAGTTIAEAAGDGTTAATWRVTSKRGERATLPFAGDTGLTDGDV